MDKRDGKFGPQPVMMVPPIQQMSRMDQPIPPAIGYPPQPTGMPYYPPPPPGYPTVGYPPPPPPYDPAASAPYPPHYPTQPLPEPTSSTPQTTTSTLPESPQSSANPKPK